MYLSISTSTKVLRPIPVRIKLDKKQPKKCTLHTYYTYTLGNKKLSSMYVYICMYRG